MKRKEFIDNIKQMKDEELLAKLNELLAKKREVRFNMEYGQVEDKSSLKQTRRNIARIKTVLKERNVQM